MTGTDGSSDCLRYPVCVFPPPESMTKPVSGLISDVYMSLLELSRWTVGVSMWQYCSLGSSGINLKSQILPWRSPAGEDDGFMLTDNSSHHLCAYKDAPLPWRYGCSLCGAGLAGRHK